MKVLNKYKDKIPEDAIYIGRPSKWGNPFEIGKDGTRKQVIEKYHKWILNNPDLIKQARAELIGKDLVCFCSPNLCHGDILVKIITERRIDEY